MQKETKNVFFMKHCYILIATLLCFTSAVAEEWRSIGMATIVDGWITPGYVDDAGQQIDPSTCPFEVPVEESVATPGVYRLINPFGGKDFHLSEFNIEPSEQNIVIDARDRTFVIIQPQYCGFTDADSSEPSGKYPYYLSDMGTYMYNLGQQREVINMLKCASTMIGNTIIVAQPTFGTNADHAIEAWDPSFKATITLPDTSTDDKLLWERIGTATVTDGWIVPGFKDDHDVPFVPSDHQFKCDIEFNTENPNLYCLVNPYKSATFDMAYSNLSSSNVRIIFDVTDPEFVKIEPQFSGYISRIDNDINALYITDAGTLLASRNETKEEIMAKGYNSTMGDQVITVPQPLFGFDLDNVGKMWNNSHATIITWGDNGVTDVTTGDESCAIEYYNLQGLKVENPEPGKLYIRRQGSSVVKIVY